MRQYILTLICAFVLSPFAYSQDHSEERQKHETTTTEEQQEAGCGDHKKEAFNPGATAFHHISDQNIYNIGPWSIPLPCILYNAAQGWSLFSSGKFHIGEHGNGHTAIDHYILVEGVVRRVTDASFPMGEVEIGHHPVFEKVKQDDGKLKETAFVCYNDQLYPSDAKSTADGGLFGGGVTSFYDFSLTKNVVTMMLMFAFLTWMFITVAKAYKTRDGMAPKGMQSFIEPIFLFIQDEVAKPFLGNKWEKYLPFLMAQFFFILGLNLFGQIPFLGGSNVTGNIAVTMVLAVITFFVVNLSSNKNYWEHILWMPGVPAWVKTILTPVEVLGLFIKPVTLTLRLFANITAGHMVIVIFVGLIFLFGKSGESVGASYGTAAGSTLLTMFMMAIELLVAFIQAFVFAILTASYIGAATEEAHH
ncbi:MAG: ATP synthase F0 subunit A [Saprospiraceae bacterium]|nr:MAG: ATP synthase F0 subunit A [Saprospiraceae bacterium]